MPPSDPPPTLFATTRWTLIVDAARGAETAAIDALGGSVWKTQAGDCHCLVAPGGGNGPSWIRAAPGASISDPVVALEIPPYRAI